ncbi:hypothetical protein L917_01261 [Phytophthora nicotianae]|uniref:DUF659 domain-containing protein n=1 Tax=Phytophthora nicotianae TaxID=4792 RepID=W2M078_PHYNI|nr:hypothetical protein L917_01261 [Phytophthora nicotianae]
MVFSSLLHQTICTLPDFGLSSSVSMLSSPAARSSAPSASTDGSTQSASAAVATSKSPPTKCGRRKGPAWDEVIAADGIVSCKKCERIIRQMGETHVERHIALWFYSTGMAFHKVSHSSLLQALQILHPGVEIPSARELATSLLDMCYGDFKVMVPHKLRVKKCTLNKDAWLDIKGRSVIDFYVLNCEGESYFLESNSTGSTSHEAVFLATDMKRGLHSQKFTTVVAIVSDNTAANRLMWSTLQ